MKLRNARFVVTNTTGTLGRDVLTILSEMDVPPGHVAALAETRGNDDVSYGESHVLKFHAAETFIFEKDHVVLHTGDAKTAPTYAKKVAAAGGLFIDGSGAFAFDPDVQLIVPEVNGALLKEGVRKNIVANPNSIAILASLALHPINIKAKLTRAVISTYQAVSHWGQKAQDELFNQTKAQFMMQSVAADHLPKNMAFNCFPMLGTEREDGMSEVEFQAIAQLKKILGAKIKFAVNTVTVPAFIGDGMNINVETADEISPIKAALWMTGQKSLGVVDSNHEMPTHADVGGEDVAYVSRLRDDFSVENGLAFWLIGDNLRKGSALNMVQIAEMYLGGK